MKKNLFFITAIILTLLLSVSTMAAERTKAFSNLMNKIVAEKSEENLPGAVQKYMVDIYGNEWYYINSDNAVCVYTEISNYDDAVKIADILGTKSEYKIPFTKDVEGPWYYDVIIPVYKNTVAELICARPVNLYPAGFKVVKRWQLNDNNDILLLNSKPTASFMLKFRSENITGELSWGQDWFPEEVETLSTSEMIAFDNTFENMLNYYPSIDASNNTQSVTKSTPVESYTMPIPRYNENQYKQDVDLYIYGGLAEKEALNKFFDNMQPPKVEYGEIPNGSGFFP